MRSSAEKKVSGGKLVCVELEYNDRINEIKILGDFFLYPEDSLQKIENALVGMSIDASPEEISKRISKVAEEEGAEFLGMTPKDIAETICAAVKKCGE